MDGLEAMMAAAMMGDPDLDGMPPELLAAMMGGDIPGQMGTGKKSKGRSRGGNRSKDEELDALMAAMAMGGMGGMGDMDGLDGMGGLSEEEMMAAMFGMPGGGFGGGFGGGHSRKRPGARFTKAGRGGQGSQRPKATASSTVQNSTAADDSGASESTSTKKRRSRGGKKRNKNKQQGEGQEDDEGGEGEAAASTEEQLDEENVYCGIYQQPLRLSDWSTSQIYYTYRQPDLMFACVFF